jgi:hypothetical protein
MQSTIRRSSWTQDRGPNDRFRRRHPADGSLHRSFLRPLQSRRSRRTKSSDVRGRNGRAAPERTWSPAGMRPAKKRPKHVLSKPSSDSLRQLWDRSPGSYYTSGHCKSEAEIQLSRTNSQKVRPSRRLGAGNTMRVVAAQAIDGSLMNGPAAHVLGESPH